MRSIKQILSYAISQGNVSLVLSTMDKSWEHFNENSLLIVIEGLAELFKQNRSLSQGELKFFYSNDKRSTDYRNEIFQKIIGFLSKFSCSELAELLHSLSILRINKNEEVISKLCEEILHREDCTQYYIMRTLHALVGFGFDVRDNITNMTVNMIKPKLINYTSLNAKSVVTLLWSLVTLCVELENPTVQAIVDEIILRSPYRDFQEFELALSLWVFAVLDIHTDKSSDAVSNMFRRSDDIVRKIGGGNITEDSLDQIITCSFYFEIDITMYSNLDRLIEQKGYLMEVHRRPFSSELHNEIHEYLKKIFSFLVIRGFGKKLKIQLEKEKYLFRIFC